MATINARLVIYHFVIPFPICSFLHLCVFVIFLDLREAEPRPPRLASPRAELLLAALVLARQGSLKSMGQKTGQLLGKGAKLTGRTVPPLERASSAPSDWHRRHICKCVSWALCLLINHVRLWMSQLSSSNQPYLQQISVWFVRNSIKWALALFWFLGTMQAV